jgi:hypothetical protein
MTTDHCENPVEFFHNGPLVEPFAIPRLNEGVRGFIRRYRKPKGGGNAARCAQYPLCVETWHRGLTGNAS